MNKLRDRKALEEKEWENAVVDYMQGKSLDDFSKHLNEGMASPDWWRMVSGVSMPPRFARTIFPCMAGLRGKAVMETNPTQGAALVAGTLPASQLQYPAEAVSLFQRTTQVPCPRDRIEWPKMSQEESGTVNELADFGYPMADWIADGAEIPDGGTRIRPFEIVTWLQGAYMELSNMLMTWLDVDPEALFRNFFQPAILYRLDRGLVEGNGASQPRGILNTEDVQEVARGTPGQVTYADLVEMDHKLPPQLRPAAAWSIADDTVKALKLQTGADDRPLIAANALTGLDTLLGHPVAPMQNRTAGQSGDVILGHFGHYICPIGENGTVVLRRSDHLLFRRGLVAFTVWVSAGGQAAQPRCFVKLV